MIDSFDAGSLFEHYFADADRLVADGIASAEDVDTAMRLGAGFPLGPFEARGHPSRRDVPEPTEVPPVWAKAAVIGTGHMASGIAESIARAGRAVDVIGRSSTSAARSRAAIVANLDRAVARERITSDEASAIIGRISFRIGVDHASAADVVIEAVAEDLELKQRLVTEIDEVLPDDAVLATNTSSYRVAEIMRDVAKTRPVFALHFFNPAAAMKLLEVVPGPGSAEGIDTAEAWARQLGKTPVRSADSRGFIVNRLLIPYLNDAVRLHEAGVPIETIDIAMTEDAHLPMGPFALLDLIGIDVTVAALESMAESEDIARLRPADRLSELMQAGRLGRKVGAGFYTKGR